MPASRLAVTTPVSVVAEITIAIATSATYEIAIAIASITPESVVRDSRMTVGSTTVPSTVTCVVTVNKLFTLFIPV
jgi:hypothetical protein